MSGMDPVLRGLAKGLSRNEQRSTTLIVSSGIAANVKKASKNGVGTSVKQETTTQRRPDEAEGGKDGRAGGGARSGGAAVVAYPPRLVQVR